MSRWVGIILVVALYFVFNKQLETSLIGETKPAVPKKSFSQKFSFPQVERKIVNAARSSATVMNPSSQEVSPKVQCFNDMLSESRCDFDCWAETMDRQGSQLPELALRNWKKQDPKFNFKNQSDIYGLYHALNLVGLLTGGDETVEPQYDKAIDILTELSLKDPKNYYPYLFLAQIHHMKGESFEVTKTLQQMDENAQYYNNFYSAWFAQLEKESALSLDVYNRAIIVGSTLPIPSLRELLRLEKYYKFNKRKLLQAMVESVEQSKKAHKYSLLSVSMIDFMVAAQMSQNPKLKARKNEMFNPGLNMFLEKFASDFPVECERTAVEAWFQKHRSEIQ